MFEIVPRMHEELMPNRRRLIMSRGKHTYPDGSIYEGDIEGGKRHGQGIWVKTDGTKYSGQWKNDKPDGQGTITWPDGRRYSGNWKAGKRHGQGIEIFSDGRKIEGFWEEGELAQEKKQAVYDEDEYFEEVDDNYDDEPESDYRSQGEGFLKSLFDVSMKEMITPKIIRVLYIIGLIGIVLGVLGSLVAAIFAASTAGIGTLLVSLITIPIGAFLAVVFLRVYLELIILFFNIYDQLKEIRANQKQ